MAELPDADTKKMHDLCDYIVRAKASSLELTLDLTEEQMKQCSVSYNRKGYYKFDATPELSTAPSYEFLEVLSEFSQLLVSEYPLQDGAPTFTKYANLEGTPRTTIPKLIIYSGHASNVAPMMQILLPPQFVNPKASAMIVVNYYKCASCTGDEQNQVEISYLDHSTDDPSKSVTLKTMTFVEFEAFIVEKQGV